MIVPPIPVLLASDLLFPEGPVFAPDGSLWCVELQGGGLVCLRNGTIQKIQTSGSPNGLAVDAAGRIYLCDAGENAIRRLDPASGEIENLAREVDGVPLNKPNDLAFDFAGNLVFTCPGNSRTEPTGYVCSLTPAGNVRIIASGLYFPNGLAFTADGGELIIAETYRQRLWRGAWDATKCVWENPQIWASDINGSPGPDGMAFAADGTLHVAVFGSGEVKVFSPAGLQTGAYTIPGRNPTNCAFDPSGRLGLVVTEAELGNLWSLPLSQHNQNII